MRILRECRIGLGLGILYAMSFFLVGDRPATASDWPCWRGPNKNGSTTETIAKWPMTEVWRASVGQGYSDVSISGGRVYTMGWAGNQDTVYCFSESATGNASPLWTQSYSCGTVDHNGTRCTPTVDGNEVYTFSIQGLLSCYDKTAGTPRWSKQITSSAPSWGFASSPLIEGNLVIVNAGGQGTAVDKTTHNFVWGNDGNASGYSSAFAFTRNGTDRTVVIYGANTVYGINPADSTVRWSFGAGTSYGSMADPMIYNDQLFVSRGYGQGCALANLGSGTLVALWSKGSLKTKENPCVIYNGYAYGVDESSGLQCLELATGNVKWSHSGFNAESSVLLAGTQLVVQCGTDGGGAGPLAVVQPNPAAYTEVYRTNGFISGDTMTCPTLANGHLYVRSLTGTLICYDVSAPTNPPVITSSTSASGAVGIPFSYQITASGNPTNYNATGLPNGLTVNRANGLISGTPTATGTSSVTISAINPNGTGQATLTVTINPGGSLGGSGVAGGTTAIDLTAEGTDDWAHWGYSGTSIDHKSVSGSAVNHITESNTGSLTRYTDNANGFTWSDGTPTANVVASTTGIYVSGAGNGFTFTVPADTTSRTLRVYVGGYTSSGTLTAHLSDGSAVDYVNSSFSNLSGTYTAVFTITYKAGVAGQTLSVSWNMASGSGNVTMQAATLQGAGSAPVITSATSASGTVNQAFSYQITASGSPTNYNATGLPTGLTVNRNTGLISGTPTGVNTSSVTISAINSFGSGQATLTLAINAAPPAPVITSALGATGTVNQAFSYQITASASPTNYNATGLPPGLTVNRNTGLISGTPTGVSTSSVTISAINANGSGQATLTLAINGVPPAPVITSALAATGTVGQAFSYQITASGSPTNYNATGLPAGLNVNRNTGVISGTPTTNGVTAVTISAINSNGTGQATLTLTINAAPSAPVITSATTANGTIGQAFSYQITASGSPTNYNATGLPAGLTVNRNTGLISGTPTTNGVTPVTISAINGSGTGTATLTITINATSPGPSGLVGWWKLDESVGTTAADSSGNGNNGTLSGGTWQVSGGHDAGAIHLNAADVVNCGAAASLNTPSVTVAFWMKADSLGNVIPVDKLPTTGSVGYAVKLRDNGSIWFRVGAEGGPALDVYGANNIYTNGVWVHVACTFDAGTGNMRMYINGVVEGHQPTFATTLNASSITFRMGSTVEQYAGLLDDVRVYDHALTSNEVVTVILGGGGPTPDVDTDGDGMSDADELIAGTDPNSATSVFKITQCAAGFTNSGILSLSCPSVTGRFYVVQTTTNIMSGTWVNVPDPAYTNIPGSGMSLAISTNISQDAVNRCFRIKVRKP
jgi:hypothetical protein